MLYKIIQPRAETTHVRVFDPNKKRSIRLPVHTIVTLIEKNWYLERVFFYGSHPALSQTFYARDLIVCDGQRLLVSIDAGIHFGWLEEIKIEDQ